MHNLFVILPCYNEQENIQALLESWIDQDESLQKSGYILSLLPIDDGSKDDTRSIIERMGQEKLCIKPIIHERNLGLGGGVQTGLRYFKEHGADGDWAVIMDADNTHDPKYIFSMLDKAKAEKLDCVIASRYCNTSKTVGVPVFREFLSMGARLYYTLVLRVKNVKDYTCGYRIYNYSIINRAYNKYGYELVTERGFSCMMEVLYKLYRIGCKFGEVPFDLRYDLKQGSSKMRVLKTVYNSIVTAMKLRIKV